MNTPGPKRYKILVVDDEASICRAIMMLLQIDGHQVETASGGEAALALFASGQFDLIITDYAMPDMTGGELAAEIKKRRPGQPVIMVTAFAGQLQKKGGLPTAVDYLVRKPFSPEDLQAAVADVLG